jgi:hypothetical protein
MVGVQHRRAPGVPAVVRRVTLTAPVTRIANSELASERGISSHGCRTFKKSSID